MLPEVEFKTKDELDLWKGLVTALLGRPGSVDFAESLAVADTAILHYRERLKSVQQAQLATAKEDYARFQAELAKIGLKA